jgi:hypothetical protein
VKSLELLAAYIGRNGDNRPFDFAPTGAALLKDGVKSKNALTINPEDVTIKYSKSVCTDADNECRAKDPSTCRIHGKASKAKGRMSVPFDEEAERGKIRDGTYSSHLHPGKQEHHVHGSSKFMQIDSALQSLGTLKRQSYITVDAQELINEHKGAGRVYEHRSSSEYPREDVRADRVIGKAWSKREQKYVDTREFTIVYSGSGAHIFPIFEED